MSNEDLMKPRYKIIAQYPMCIQVTGFIYENVTKHKDAFMSQYPHLFKKLEWWEERDFSELPLYVRFGDFDKQHAIYKVESWGKLGEDFKDMEPCGHAKNEYFISLRFPNNYPATEEEYNAQQSPTDRKQNLAIEENSIK